MYLVEPKTREAKQWVNENVDSEQWQWQGDSLAIESRCIGAIFQAIVDSDLDTNADFNIRHSRYS